MGVVCPDLIRVVVGFGQVMDGFPGLLHGGDGIGVQAQGPEAHDGLPIADDGDGIGCCHVLPSLRAGPPQAGPDDLRA